MRFSVSVPVLSVQMTVVEPSVSTALRRFTSAPRRARVRTPTASASVIVGSSPSGTFATSRPMAKTSASPNGSPAERAEREEGDADCDRDDRDQPRDAADLLLERALLALHALGERSDPPQLGLHAGREDHRRAPPPVQLVPLKTRSRASSSGSVAGSPGAAERETGTDSPVSVDMSTSSAPVEQARVGRDTLSLLEHHHVARARAPRASTTAASPVAHDERLLREGSAASASTARSACRSWTKAKSGVEEDHGDDRAGQDGACPQRGEAGRHPEEERERVDELLDELPRPASLAAALELVRAVRDEPPRSLAGREPLRGAPVGRAERGRARSNRRQGRPPSLGRTRRVARVSRRVALGALRSPVPGFVCRQETSTAA